MNLIGLNFEASGADPWDKHAPIQIRVALTPLDEATSVALPDTEPEQ